MAEVEAKKIVLKNLAGEYLVPVTEPYVAGEGIKIEDNVISVTGISDDVYTKDEVDNLISGINSKFEETLLELKAKIDALVENSGSTGGEDEPITTSVNPNAFDNYDTSSGHSYIYWVNNTFEGSQEELENIYTNGEPVSNAADSGSSFDNLTLMYSYYDAAHSTINYQSTSSDMTSSAITYTVTDDKAYMTDGKLTFWRYGTSTTPELDAYNEVNTGDSDDTEDIETVTIDGYTAKVATETIDGVFWTRYTFIEPIIGEVSFTCTDSEGQPVNFDILTDLTYSSNTGYVDTPLIECFDDTYGVLYLDEYHEPILVLSFGGLEKITIISITVEN